MHTAGVAVGGQAAAAFYGSASPPQTPVPVKSPFSRPSPLTAVTTLCFSVDKPQEGERENARTMKASRNILCLKELILAQFMGSLDMGDHSFDKNMPEKHPL